jgi:hypothetical protein
MARAPALVVLEGVGEEGLEVLADEPLKDGLAPRDFATRSRSPKAPRHP